MPADRIGDDRPARGRPRRGTPRRRWSRLRWLRTLPRGPRHHHTSRAQDPVAHPIATALDLDDLAIGHRPRRHCADRLLPGRVELADRLVLDDPAALEDALQ